MRRLVILFAFTVLLTTTVQATEIHPGQPLYEKHCTQCHGSEVMTRSDRRVNDLQQLDAQVRQCDSNLGLQLFDEDIEAVSQYLNRNFYHFK
ncbi:MAG: cytochrome c [Pseudomonadota bacterium]